MSNPAAIIVSHIHRSHTLHKLVVCFIYNKKKPRIYGVWICDANKLISKMLQLT